MQAQLAILDLGVVQVFGLMRGQEQLGKDDSQRQGEPEPLGISNLHCLGCSGPTKLSRFQGAIVPDSSADAIVFSRARRVR